MALRCLLDVAAPAKLNLFLHVIGRRDDGYHLLQSVFVLIDWCDRLDFERRDDGRLARHDRGVALPADDLCLRAARALQQASGTPHGADIHVDKQVPWGAGMGGGSSDAASTLLALNRSLYLSCVLLFASGVALMIVLSCITSLVQLIAPNEMRGRVMSIYLLAFRGGMPLGSLVSGYLASRTSAPTVLAINGLALLAVSVFFLTKTKEIRSL